MAILGKGTDGSNGDKTRHSGVILRWVEVCNGATGYFDSDLFTMENIGPKADVDATLSYQARSESWLLELTGSDGLLLKENRMGSGVPSTSHGEALDWATGRIVSYFLFGSAWQTY